MKVQTLNWSPRGGWTSLQGSACEAHLVLYFGSRAALACGLLFDELRERFPGAVLAGCSTGGQIAKGDVSDDGVVAIAVSFERSRVVAIEEEIAQRSVFATGQAIGGQLAAPDLRSIFVLSDGISVNGSELVAGILNRVSPDVLLTGGLAGDGADFRATLVGGNAPPRPGRVAAVGFYGAGLRLGHGSAGGWDQFGPMRRITRSHSNVLFELDGKPALDLYEHYLGEDAAGLPSTGLLYPLLITNPVNTSHTVVRTILSVDQDKRSMTFAGDMPQGWTAQLMRGHFDRLADGAGEAARQAKLPEADGDSLGILVSCIGRRILMGQQIIDEIAATRDVLGEAMHTVGFYSYGEISPHAVSGVCELHNQTMTVTTLSEAA